MKSGRSEFLSRSTWWGHALGVTMTLALLAAYIVFVRLPLQTKIREASNEISRLSQLVANQDQTTYELTRLNAQFTEAIQRVEQIRNRIAGNRQEAEILEHLSKFADAQRMTIVDYRRGNVTQLDRVSKFDVEIRCFGSFVDACSLVNEIHHLEQLATIEEFQIDTAEDPSRYPINLTLTLYYQTTPQAPQFGLLWHGESFEANQHLKLTNLLSHPQ